MIVALTGTDHNRAAASLARTLAILRTSAGSKVLLVSPEAETGQARFDLKQACDGQRYDDVVIDASGDAMGDSGSALAAAGVIVVLIHPAELEARHHGALLVRIKTAVGANPRAQVLVAVGHTQKTFSAHEVGNILVFVAQMSSARLVDTLVLEEGGSYRSRHGEVALANGNGGKGEDADDDDDDTLDATEIRHLYGQVFRAATASV